MSSFRQWSLRILLKSVGPLSCTRLDIFQRHANFTVWICLTHSMPVIMLGGNSILANIDIWNIIDVFLLLLHTTLQNYKIRETILYAWPHRYKFIASLESQDSMYIAEARYVGINTLFDGRYYVFKNLGNYDLSVWTHWYKFMASFGTSATVCCQSSICRK
jgi:hypothetical protein